MNAYLKYPHINGDTITFIAEDDVWLASLADSRAAAWKNYRGGAAARLYLGETGSGQIRSVLSNHSSPLVSLAWVGLHLVVISDGLPDSRAKNRSLS